MFNLVGLAVDLFRHGDKLRRPKVSDWKIVSPSNTSLSVDIADVVTGGAAAVVPINVDLSAGYFVTGFENSRVGFSTGVSGYGAGIGVGAGWAPTIKGSGNLVKLANTIMSNGINLGITTGSKIEFSKNIGQLISGPRASSDCLSVKDFEGVATVISLEIKSTIIGTSFSLVLFADKPVTDVTDLINVKSLGLFVSGGAAMALSAGGSVNYFKVSFG